jgi:hypothetical protein
MKGVALLALTLGACSSAHTEPHHHAKRTPAPAVTRDVKYADHIAALHTKLEAKQLHATIRVEEPFIVIGDGSEEALAHDAQTVRWAADHLEADFFEHRPKQILDIYLFHDAESYERGVIALTGEAPTTPYGFYSKAHGGLFMNIATGGGTLVHEIVHPYVEADFPNAPPWLNEGLGSLFEQSAEKDGHIIGLTNWRLEGLQHAIDRGDVMSFKTLAHLDTDAFYGDEKGVNYAESRYLLYYLQQRGLLHEFYRSFRTARKADPSGYATLVATLGETDMDDFTSRWTAYVKRLVFP